MRSRLILVLAVAVAVTGCRTLDGAGSGRDGGRMIAAVDSGGRPIARLESGSSLELTAEGLTPRALYQFDLTLDGQRISFARAASDRRGRIPPFVLWYQSGVIGCATREADRLRPIRFRTFDEAEQALAGKTLRVTATEVGAASRPLSFDLPVARRRSPMVYPSNESGCLVNAVLTGSADLFVTGRNFAPNETLSVSLVPNQRAWYTGDRVLDVTGASEGARRVIADASGRFTVRAWDAPQQRRGVYDVVVQRHGRRTFDLTRIDPLDIVSYGSDTGVVVYLLYPPGSPYQDLAGRPLPASPYFQFADSFADKDDDVWAAVDPTFVPPDHPGGIYAGYHVVGHRTAIGWNPLGGSNDIADLSSNGVEVMPVKAGCINAVETIVWPADVPAGAYDVVVDFGQTPASSSATYVPDGKYDFQTDFLDGAVQIGFRVAKDPYELGPIPIGIAGYSVDDYFPSFGNATNVDLHATVRYPATTAGTNTPVADGAHPLFIVQHGNHWMCRVCTDGSLFYDRYKEATDALNWGTFWQLCTYDHVTCPDRTRNHEGYNRLLEILASHGIIAVSIDAYDLTGVEDYLMEERADLILEHLKLWSHVSDSATYPSYFDPFDGLFAGKVNLAKISVSGHSRGGEAAVAAYLRNELLPQPFSIAAVSSIAPVDSLMSVLPSVPYFVILPAADGDVTDLRGVRIYDRAGGSVGDATTKSSIYVYGANHNFFNTVWAEDWDDYQDGDPGRPLRPDFIPAPDQQRLGEAYLAAFTRIHLKSETVYEDFFRGGLVFPSTAGWKIYHTHHESSHAKIENGDGTNGGPSGGAGTVVTVAWPHVQNTLRIGWPSTAAAYTWTVPPEQRDTTAFEVLSFRVAQTKSPWNPMSDQDFLIELAGGGQTRGVFAGQFDAIPPPYQRVDTLLTVMTTVRVPLHSFIVNESGVTLNDIDTIRFRFLNVPVGDIHVDDVEFSR